MTNMQKHVETLIEKATTEHNATEAMKYAQAASNAASAIAVLVNTFREPHAQYPK